MLIEKMNSCCRLVSFLLALNIINQINLLHSSNYLCHISVPILCSLLDLIEDYLPNLKTKGGWKTQNILCQEWTFQILLAKSKQQKVFQNFAPHAKHSFSISISFFYTIPIEIWRTSVQKYSHSFHPFWLSQECIF